MQKIKINLTIGYKIIHIKVSQNYHLMKVLLKGGNQAIGCKRKRNIMIDIKGLKKGVVLGLKLEWDEKAHNVNENFILLIFISCN